MRCFSSAFALALACLLVPLQGALAQGPPGGGGGGGPGLAVQAEQDLSFGELLGSLAAQVSPGDPDRGARYRIRGRNMSVEFSFFLPPELLGPGASTVPLSFGFGDAGYSPTESPLDMVPFDPTSPTTITLTNGNWSAVFLGGTALPPGNAALGEYSATVTLTVAELGN